MSAKAALCFVINYDHELAKERIWREWIEPNKDIINVYFYYADLDKIKSPWVREHVIDASYIRPTTYMNVMPAYLGLLRAALTADGRANEWIIFLTDFCVPLISPKQFRHLFFSYYDRTFMPWRTAWWDVNREHRANLHLISEKYRLANSPWFTLSRTHGYTILQFIRMHSKLAETIFNGTVANESFFAIALDYMGVLRSAAVVPLNTHIADWERMSSATSPHKFELAGEPRDRHFIESNLSVNPFAMFLRKVMPTFPDATIEHYIYQWRKDADAKLVVKKPLLLRLPLWIRRRTSIINAQRAFVILVATIAIAIAIVFSFPIVISVVPVNNKVANIV